MNQQDFEQLFRSWDNRIYDYYRLWLYRMQEHPILFWAMFLLAIKGLVWW